MSVTSAVSAAAAEAATAARSAVQSSRVPGRRTSGFLARWRSDAEYFESVRKRLLGRPGFHGVYVAVLNGQIVGTDRDELSLFRAVTEAYGDVPLFIGRVERQPRVRRIPSPRVRRSGS